MKKSILLLIISLLCALTLFSCGDTQSGSDNAGNTGDNSSNGDNATDDNANDNAGDNSNNSSSGDTADKEEVKIPENTIYGNGVVPTIICSASIDDTITEPAIRALAKSVSLSAKIWASLKSDADASNQREMVFGDTTREISKTAKAILLEKMKESYEALAEEEIPQEDVTGFIIYSDGKSVAVVWSDFQIAPVAIQYFSENYIQKTEDGALIVEAGHVKTEFFSLLNYLEEREDKLLEEKWAALAEVIPEKYREDIVRELKNLYDFYGEDMVEWLANLYEPAVGGWYHSNSARDDTKGFSTGTERVPYLPDIENTYVALTLVAATGMAEMFGGDWVKAMPDWLLEDVGNWVQSMQNPDTFFYHPQWPKYYIEANGLQSRITRDRGSAKALLRAIGVPIKYTSYTASNTALPSELFGESTAAAVSKVVSASSNMLWQYESVENFAKYIEQLEAEIAPLSDSSRAWKFYYYGNNFQSTTNYINADTTGQMKKMTIDFFNKYQNPETGVWSSGLYYDSANGIHKIAAVFNSLGAELKYVDKMVSSIVEILMFDPETNPASGGVNIYNTWSCFPYIYTNIRNCSSGTIAEKYAKCNEIKDLVYSLAADAIRNSYEHIKGMKQADGSFGYGRTGSSSHAQGCPAAVPGSREGDVNGNALCTYDIVHFITLALELESVEIPMFTEEDRVVFVRTIESNREKIRAQSVGESTVYDFESDEVGSAPSGLDILIDSGRNEIPGSKISVVADDSGNKLLSFNMRNRGEDTNGRNFHIKFPATSICEYPTKSKIELTLTVQSSTMVGSNICELTVGRASDGACIIQPKIGRAANGVISIYDHNGTKIGDIGTVDTLIKLVIDYDWANKTYYIYSNGSLVGKAISSYGNNRHTLPGGLTVGSASTVVADYLIDDVKFTNYR